MPSRGGSRTGAGRPIDPNSMRSVIKGLTGKEDWVTLPADGRATVVPEWPLKLVTVSEFDLWGKLWLRPQSAMWEINHLEFQVAAYVRTFFEAAEPGALAGIKSATIRMEAELGLSLPGMKTLGWQIASVDSIAPDASVTARQTSSSNWLKSVSVAGS